MQTTPQACALEKRSYTVFEIMEILNKGKISAYKLAHSGLFRVVKVGTGIRISKRSFDKWFESYEDPFDSGSF